MDLQNILMILFDTFDDLNSSFAYGINSYTTDSGYINSMTIRDKGTGADTVLNFKRSFYKVYSGTFTYSTSKNLIYTVGDNETVVSVIVTIKQNGSPNQAATGWWYLDSNGNAQSGTLGTAHAMTPVVEGKKVYKSATYYGSANGGTRYMITVV